MAAGYDVHLTISAAGRLVLEQELDVSVDLDNFQSDSLLLGGADSGDSKLSMLRQFAGISSEDSNVLAFEVGSPGKIHYHQFEDYMAPIASGSFLTSGMIICPCSSGSLGAHTPDARSRIRTRAARSLYLPMGGDTPRQPEAAAVVPERRA